jgi:hypothetical protein
MRYGQRRGELAGPFARPPAAPGQPSQLPCRRERGRSSWQDLDACRRRSAACRP